MPFVGKPLQKQRKAPRRSKTLDRILGLKLLAGTYTLEVYSKWCNATDMGSLSHEAAEFWSQRSRAELLCPSRCIDDILDEWENYHGDPPMEGTPEYEELIELENDDSAEVHKGVVIQFPVVEENFFRP